MSTIYEHGGTAKRQKRYTVEYKYSYHGSWHFLANYNSKFFATRAAKSWGKMSSIYSARVVDNLAPVSSDANETPVLTESKFLTTLKGMFKLKEKK